MTWKIICSALLALSVYWQIKWHMRHAGDSFSVNAAFDLMVVVAGGITVCSILAYEIIR